MKKFFLTLTCLFFIPFFSFSMGNGGLITFQENIFYNSHNEKAGGASFTMKPDNTNIFFELYTGWNFSNNYFFLTCAMDYKLFEIELLPNFNLYGNAGLKSGFDFFENGKFSLAPQFVLGFSFIFFDGFLEFFIQQAVQQNVRFNFGPEFSIDYPRKLPLGIGFRIWD